MLTSHQFDIKSVKNAVGLGCGPKITTVICHFIFFLLLLRLKAAWIKGGLRSSTVEVQVRVRLHIRWSRVSLHETGVQGWPKVINIWSEWHLIWIRFHLFHVYEQLFINKLFFNVKVYFVMTKVAFFTPLLSFIYNADSRWSLVRLKVAPSVWSRGWTSILELGDDLCLDALVLREVLSAFASVVFLLV